jgi:hypothetical protein
VAERRSWVQALSVSRLEARIAYLDDEAYLRGIFSPADVRRRATTQALAESDGPSATASQPETQGVLASLHLLPASAVTPVQAPSATPAKAPPASLLHRIGSPSPQDAGHAAMACKATPVRNLWFDTRAGLSRLLC